MSDFVAEDFWNPWEARVSSISELIEVISKIQVIGDCDFVWRGQEDASWSLNSSLHRTLEKMYQPRTNSKRIPEEHDVNTAEKWILQNLKEWNLHLGEEGARSAFIVAEKI